MTFPNMKLNVIDPGIGVTAANPDIPFYSGISFGGTAPVDTVVSVGSLTQVRDLLGYGPLAEDVALALQQRGGPVLAARHDVTGTALSSAPMNQSDAGPAIAISGIPSDTYHVAVEVTTGGAEGVARFRYSLDYDPTEELPTTWSQIRTIPLGLSYAIANSGLTLEFTTGTFIQGEIYDLETEVDEVTAVDLGAIAAELLSSTSLLFPLWLVSGQFADATDASAVAAALGGHLTSLEASFRYARGGVDAGSGDTSSNVLDEAENWVDARVFPSYGEVRRLSALPFEGFSSRRTAAASGFAARAARELISTDLSRTASGPDSGVQRISFDGSLDQQLDAAKIGTMRTWPGIPGFYFANAPLKSPFGSDFTDLQFGRVMDAACRTTFTAQFPFISEGIRTIDTGAINPLDAADIQEAVQSALEDNLLSPSNARGLPGHVSSVTYTVDLLHNVVTTNQLKTSVSIRPLGYAKEIVTDLFFSLEG